MGWSQCKGTFNKIRFTRFYFFDDAFFRKSHFLNENKRKADSTLRCSQAVPHPSTNRALRRLTPEVRRDPVYSTRYGRQRYSSWCNEDSKSVSFCISTATQNKKQNQKKNATAAEFMGNSAICRVSSYWRIQKTRLLRNFSEKNFGKKICVQNSNLTFPHFPH